MEEKDTQIDDGQVTGGEAFQPYLPHMEAYIEGIAESLLVSSLTPDELELLGNGFLEKGPHNPLAIASVLYTCAHIYTGETSQFNGLIYTLHQNAGKDYFEQFALFNRMSSTYAPDRMQATATVSMLPSITREGFKQENTWESYVLMCTTYNQPVDPELTYYDKSTLAKDLAMPFDQFIHALLFSEPELALISRKNVSIELLEEHGLASIHEAFWKLHLGDDAFKIAHIDELVSLLVERFYIKFKDKYGWRYEKDFDTI